MGSTLAAARPGRNEANNTMRNSSMGATVNVQISVGLTPNNIPDRVLDSASAPSAGFESVRNSTCFVHKWRNGSDCDKKPHSRKRDQHSGYASAQRQERGFL